jgi:hypothetical protein
MKATPSPESQARRLRRRLWLERALFVLMLGGLGGAWAYPLVFPTVWAVSVDGVPVVALEQRELAASIARRLQRGDQEVGADGAAQPPARRVAVVAADPTQVDVADEDGAFRALTPVLGLAELRAVIRVQGAVVAALPTEHAAEQALVDLKARFAAGARELEAAPEFKEVVTVRLEPAARGLWCETPADAVQRLLYGRSDGTTLHTVDRGETAAEIAGRYGLDRQELRELNPGVTLDPLRAGARVRIARPRTPTVTVVTRLRIAEERPLPFPSVTQPDRTLYVGKRGVRHPGRPGRERVIYRVRCENGKEVGREACGVAVLEKPAPQVVAVGALPRPVRMARGKG